jgi:hypothetical protein
MAPADAVPSETAPADAAPDAGPTGEAPATAPAQ